MSLRKEDDIRVQLYAFGRGHSRWAYILNRVEFDIAPTARWRRP
jgi:hypothetical protein